MTETKLANGLLTDRLNSKDQKTDNLTNNRRIKMHQWLMTNLTWVFQPIPSWLNWPITFNGPTLWHHRLTNTIHSTLKMTSAQVVVTSVTNNSSFPNYPHPFQNYPHPDDHTIRTILYFIALIPLKLLLLPRGSHIVSCFSAWAEFRFNYMRFFLIFWLVYPGWKS